MRSLKRQWLQKSHQKIKKNSGDCDAENTAESIGHFFSPAGRCITASRVQVSEMAGLNPSNPVTPTASTERGALSQEFRRARSRRCWTLLHPYMRIGAETWYTLCERLRAEASYSRDLPPLALRLRRAGDVNMANATVMSTPVTGKKRSRDDEEEEISLEDGFRFEKVRPSRYA